MDRIKEFIDSNLYKLLGGGLAVIVGLILLLGFQIKGQSDPTTDNELIKSSTVAKPTNKETEPTSTRDNFEKQSYVDVKGAVRNPGVYQVKGNMRLIDAVELAGGFNSSADQKHINLAQKLTDQQIVYVPIRGEVKESMQKFNNLKSGQGSVQSINNDTKNESKKINLNTADATKLQELNGIGEKKAQQIIGYRKSHGKFNKIDDIKEVPGFGDKTFANLKALICV